MIQVAEAEHIVLSQAKDYGVETISFELSLGRVLAEDIKTDRELPPFNRVAMDGIAISYNAFEKGIRTFTIRGTQAAGNKPIDIDYSGECIEIMTGAALPGSCDTIVRYEDVTIENRKATINIDDIRRGQNIHPKGIDCPANETVVYGGQVIDSTVICMAASVGKTKLQVKKLPKIVIITTGGELVSPDASPSYYEIRRSNNYAIQAVLQGYHAHAELMHIPDDATISKRILTDCLVNYDVIILSGGVSKGKFDYIPQVLEDLQVKKLFHQVRQRPGKPFWFGAHDTGRLIFAFPGNPVSTFLCLHRYLVPWLKASLGIREQKTSYAILDANISFKPPLQYFVQVKLHISEEGRLTATPVEGHGSGDFANLLIADAFMELPAERDNFKKGEVYRIWPFKSIV